MYRGPLDTTPGSRVGYDDCLPGREKGTATMATKLYVGNLAWSTSSEGLRSIFEQYGSVTDAVVVTDRETGRSRGFGFVTYDDAAAADSAVSGLDGKPLDGRPIRVSLARERERERR